MQLATGIKIAAFWITENRVARSTGTWPSYYIMVGKTPSVFRGKKIVQRQVQSFIHVIQSGAGIVGVECLHPSTKYSTETLPNPDAVISPPPPHTLPHAFSGFRSRKLRSFPAGTLFFFLVLPVHVPVYALQEQGNQASTELDFAVPSRTSPTGYLQRYHDHDRKHNPDGTGSHN